MTPDVPVLALDGPSGSGKGTVARAVATRLGWHFLDSGALYRLVGQSALQLGVDLDDGPAVAETALGLQVRFAEKPGDERIWVHDNEISAQIRTEEVGAAASKVARLPAVRAALLSLQRGFRQPPGLVADGRDMGSVVFPRPPSRYFSPPAPTNGPAGVITS